jgi:hypothetical protein
MKTNKWGFPLAVAMFIAVVIACSASTANISSLKIATDEDGKNEVKSFKPGEKLYVVTQVSNNPGKVQLKFRILYDDVKGQTAGESVKNLEKTLDVDGSKSTYYWIELPPKGGDLNGRYKVEVSMLNDKGEQKDQKTGTFELTGY